MDPAPGTRLRTATDGDLPALVDADARAFGLACDADDLADARALLDPQRVLLAVRDDGPGGSERIVGATASLPLALTLPGGGELPAPGVTWVQVSLDQRRRGVLTALVREQLRGFAAAGAAASLLTASEGAIYGRFGYGPATVDAALEVDRRVARLREGVGRDGDVRQVGVEEAAEHARATHERWRRRTPGAVSRLEAQWRPGLADRPALRGGRSGLFHLVHPDGWVAYRLAEGRDARGDAAREVHVVDRFAATDEADAALWRALLSLDLMTTVHDRAAAPDDPLPHLLVDPRAARTRGLRDGLWARLLDVPAALAARRYAVEVDAVLSLRDPLLGLGGVFRLRGGPDGAACERLADEEADEGAGAASGAGGVPSADLVGDVAALASAWLGGHRLGALARAGRVRADDPRTLARLDAAFTAERAPRHGTPF